jgi:hypothetical protein
MQSRTLLVDVTALETLMTVPAMAQGFFPPDGRRGVIIQNQPNTTGNSRDVVISYGATGADTVTVRRQMIWDSLRRSGAEALVHLG